jgi:hypothetical protein
MELNDAVRRMARNYPGGLKALAARLGKSDSTLDKEIRGAHGFKLGLQEAYEIAVMCVDARSACAMDLLNLWAQATGHVLLPMPEVATGGITLERLGRLMHECGDLVAVVTNAKADGKVCDNEMKLCTAQFAELMAAGQSLMQALKENNMATMQRWHESEGV